MALIVRLPEQFRRMTLLAGEECDPGHGGIGGEGEGKFTPSRSSTREHRVATEVKRRVSADAIGREARSIGVRVGAVQGQHRHTLRCGEKMLVVSSEAESARRGGG